MANAINSLNYGNNVYVFTMPYATCSTAAGTAAKTVSVTNFSLESDARITVKFSNANSASSPTLNVNNTGAKAIYWHGAALSSGQYWEAGAVLDFVYNGTQWELIGIAKDNNTTYSSLKNPNALTIQGNGTTLTNGTYDGSAAKTVNITPASIGAQVAGSYANASHTHSDYVNQNAFSNVAVGSTTIAADSKTDTLTLAGSNVTLTPDTTNDKVTIGITKANVTSALGYTPPTTNTTYGVVSTTADGLAPKRDGSTTKYLRADGTWAVPPDTNTTYTLGSFGITATASELNALDGITATVTELNYCDGVTSNIQTQLNGKAASSHGNHVPATQTANNAIFLRNDNTWATVTPANIGAATSSHSHTNIGNDLEIHGTLKAEDADLGGDVNIGGALYVESTTLRVGGTGVGNDIGTAVSLEGHTHNNYMTKANPTGTGYIQMNRDSTSSLGECCACFGMECAPSGDYSIAAGYSCESSGESSSAFGYATIAAGDKQTTIGKFNIEDTEDKYAFIIGNGLPSARSNAMSVDWSGNAVLQGGLTIGKNNLIGFGEQTSSGAVVSPVGAQISFDGSAGIAFSGDITASGDIITSGYAIADRFKLPNNRSLRSENTDSTEATLMYLNSNNNLCIGSTSNPHLGNVAITAPNGNVNIYCDADTDTSSINLHGKTNIDGAGNITSTLGVTGITTIQARIQPKSDDSVQLGTGSLRFINVYCTKSAMNTSDLNAKRDLAKIDDRYIELFDLIEPYAFYFTEGDRVHTGFISQYVEEAMKQVGLTAEELGFFCRDIKCEYFYDDDGNYIGEKEIYDEDGNPVYVYSLRYTEYIAIMTEKIKRLENKYNSKLEELENKINELI